MLSIVKGEEPRELRGDDVIIYGINGKPISARSPNQRKMVDAFAANDLTFALGPAAPARPMWR